MPNSTKNLSTYPIKVLPWQIIIPFILTTCLQIGQCSVKNALTNISFLSELEKAQTASMVIFNVRVHTKSH